MEKVIRDHCLISISVQSSVDLKLILFYIGWATVMIREQKILIIDDNEDDILKYKTASFSYSAI